MGGVDSNGSTGPYGFSLKVIIARTARREIAGRPIVSQTSILGGRGTYPTVEGIRSEGSRGVIVLRIRLIVG